MPLSAASAPPQPQRWQTSNFEDDGENHELLRRREVDVIGNIGIGKVE